mmetsp:Transcript_58901/g.65988  ORF Transcript_58901/g.65988 Transcript_58901/m.65988 type:complete len:281 (-) Transcript_58901:1588-2430(-)
MSIWKEPSSKNAFILSWVSTLITIVFAIIGIVYYNLVGSALCLVFGLENCVDFLSSVVVLWRFYAPGKVTKEREKILKRRELRASMAISFILVLLGMSVIATSSFDIAGGTVNENEMDVMIYIAITSFLLFGTLTVFKFKFANVLNSESLYKDGVCSLIGTILSAALFANTLIIKAKPEIWWLDPFVAMICGFAALFIGIHSIFVSWKHRRVPICSLSWWLMSRGDGGRRNNNTIYNDEDNNEPAMSPIEKSERTSELGMNVKESNSGGLESTNLSGEVV